MALGGSNQVAVLLGAGGTLGTPSLSAACAQPAAVGIADFDVDGAPDVVVACAGAGLVLLPGRPSGTLGAPKAFSTGAGPMALAVADFNRDHQPDVVTANLTGASLSLLFNSQSLGRNVHWQMPLVYKFQINGTFATGSAAMGDLNGDAKTDVVVTLPDTPGIGIMLGDGAGQLSQGYVVNLVTPDPQALAMADINNDGRVDVITPSTSSNALIVSTAPVTFTATQTAYFAGTQLLPVQQAPANVVAADINLDGFMDLVVPNQSSNTLSVVLNDGTGGFRPQIPYTTGAGPAWVEAGDFNADGMADLVVANAQDNTLGIYLGHGNGVFNAPLTSPTGPHPNQLGVGDVNGDHLPDVLVANNTATVDIFFGAGDGTLVQQTGMTVPGTQAIAVTLLDVQHNGSPYLVALTNLEPWQVLLYPNLGGGTWGPALAGIADFYPTTLSLGDLNSDGYDDVVASSGTNTVSAVLSDGAGGMLLNTPSGNTPEVQNAYYDTRLAAGDFDGDGLVDVVELSSTFMGVKRGLPNANFGALQKLLTFASDTGSHSLRVADINRDGWPDIVMIVNAGVVVLLNDKSGGFAAASTYGPTGNSQGVLLDFNGDAKLDVLVGSSNALQLLLGDGAGAFTVSTAFPTGSMPHAMALGDFDHSGSEDVLVIQNGALQLFLRQGNTYVGQAVAYGPCAYGSCAAADLDRDGNLDAVVTCNTGHGLMTTFRGLGDGTFAAPVTYLEFGAPDAPLNVEDLTLDGIPDIIQAVVGGKGMAMWVGDGTGHFNYPQYLADDVHPGDMLLRDFNFDGLLDIYAYGNDWGLSLGRR